MPENRLPRKILIVASESSGDQHGASLVRELLTERPEIEVLAMGGVEMQKAGAKLLINATAHSMIGFSGSWRIWKNVISAYFQIIQYMKDNKPDLVILIDSPGLNLRLARHAKQAGCKVLYYISPQIWAWKKNRIKIIQKYVDHMAVILPFEKDIYLQAGVPVDYVGNPLVKQVICNHTKGSAREQLGLEQNQLTIGLCPGSRQSELKYIFPLMLQAAKLFAKSQPHVQFVIPVANTFTLETLLPYLLEYSELKLHFYDSDRYTAIRACDAVLATSGTMTLEIALLNVPEVIVFANSAFNFALAKILVQIDMLGLCNLIAKKMIVKELIQKDATPENMCKELTRIIQDDNYRSTMHQEMQGVIDVLSSPAGITPLRQVISRLLTNKASSTLTNHSETL